MLRKLIFAIVIAMITVNISLAFQPTPWLLEGRLINFTSLCNIDLPKLCEQCFSPEISVTIPAGTSLQTCKGLNSDFSSALIVRIQNSTDVPQVLMLPSSSDVIINGTGLTGTAFVLYFPFISIGVLKDMVWITGVGKIVIKEIQPKATVEFLYVIPKFSGEATVEFGDIGSFKLTQILFGDVNNDGVIRSNDAIIALQIAAGLREPNDYEKIAADVNEGGKIRSNDAIKILQMAVGLGAPDVNKPASIQKPITLALSELHGTAGDTVILPLKVDDNSNITGGDICIAYNSAVLQAIDVSSASNTLMVSKITDIGIVRIAFAGSGKLNGNTLANIKFKVLSDGISPLRLKNAELYGFDGNPLNTIYIDKQFRSWAVAPERSALLQNYPNPFNPETWIPYQLHEADEVVIRIHNVTGELVRELRLGYKSAGIYTSQDRSAYWDGRNEAGEHVSSGVYFYNIQAGNYNATNFWC
jgi:hypothetical protein